MPNNPVHEKMKSGGRQVAEDRDDDGKGEEQEQEQDQEEEEEEEDQGRSEDSDDVEAREELKLERIQSAVNIIASLPTPEDVQDALELVKIQVKIILYSSQIQRDLISLLEVQPEGPFARHEGEGLEGLFHRCMVSSHYIYKDNEWTLGARRDVCGASTTLVLDTEDGCMQVTMTWYWRPDDEEGFVEEFSLVQDHYEDNESSEEDDAAGASISSKPHDTQTADSTVILLEGLRTNKGVSKAEVNVEALQTLELSADSKVSLQSLLRFLVLCSRTECPKTQAKINSLTQGYDPEEDLAEISKYLCSLEVPGHAPTTIEPSAGKGSKLKKRVAEFSTERAYSNKKKRT